MKHKRPPLGILPKRIHDSMRLDNLKCAIERYLDVEHKIDMAWIKEYNELVDRKGDEE